MRKYFYICFVIQPTPILSHCCTHTFRGLSGPSRTVCSCLGNGDGLWAHYGSYHVRSWGGINQFYFQTVNLSLVEFTLEVSFCELTSEMDFVDTWCSVGPLFEVAVLRTVPPYVTHVPTLETTSVLRLSLLLFYVLVFVVFLLLNPGRKSSGHSKKG